MSEEQPTNRQGTDLISSKEFQRALANPHGLVALRYVARSASDRLGDPTANQSARTFSERLTTEERLPKNQEDALDDLDALFRRYSKVPIHSVDGMVKLHELVLDSYRAGRLIPTQTKVALEKVERELQAVQEARDVYLRRRLLEEEDFRVAAEQRLVEAQVRLRDAEARRQIETIQIAPRLVEAETQADERSYASRLRSGLVKNSSALLHKTIDNDRLEKTIGEHKRTLSILWTQIVRQIVLWVGVALLVLILYTFFVEIAGNKVPDLLAWPNQFRHAVFDGLIHR
ncbi:hypothetical protein [Psychromicrobium xiongbiense]|uniref:hypothetical protein n=1 Tax=Psychromicrobium xiongbiense TaxID=3051184 RepID=UPI002553980F|nr:hypothetical protein [Psychromicrobium sp. YIM S02556]